jgi:hypothetical protein
MRDLKDEDEQPNAKIEALQWAAVVFAIVGVLVFLYYWV